MIDKTEYEGIVGYYGEDLNKGTLRVHKKKDKFSFLIVESHSVDKKKPKLKTIIAFSVWLSNKQARDLGYSLLRMTKKFKKVTNTGNIRGR